VLQLSARRGAAKKGAQHSWLPFFIVHSTFDIFHVSCFLKRQLSTTGHPDDRREEGPLSIKLQDPSSKTNSRIPISKIKST